MEPQQNDGDGGDGSGLSIVVPAYNEARRLPGTLPRVIEYAKRLEEPAEIIVVDDGSTDGTADVAAASARAGDPVVILRSSPNRGKGAAVRQGMLAARFGHVLFTDVDLSTPIEETAKLRAALARGADVAIGSRRVAGLRRAGASAVATRARRPHLQRAGVGAAAAGDPRQPVRIQALPPAPPRASSSTASASMDSASTPRCCGSRAGSGTG